MLEQLKKSVNRIKEIKPLILNLTNSVTREFVANTQLSVGAAPIMSECDSETREIMSTASALYINIGTLNESSIAHFESAANIAHELNKPIILDPVGCGFTTIRTNTAQQLLSKASVVRGNASEIQSLNNACGDAKGVESTHDVVDAISDANDIAKDSKTTVVVSGVTDYITDGQSTEKLDVGSSMMAHITGMGCALTAVIAAFSAVNDDYFAASAQATLFFGLTGSAVAKRSNTPADFKLKFIDALYKPNWSTLELFLEIQQFEAAL